MSRTDIQVLLVDDSEDDRQWVLGLLRECPLYQCAVVEADCLQSADTSLQHSKPDLIIVDWELPDGAGIELAQHPYVVGEHIPVIVVTGSVWPDLGVSAVGLGAADFLPKDELTVSCLSRACGHALVRSKLEQTLAQAREAERAAASGEREARLAAEAALTEERRARERVSALHVLSSELGDLVDLDQIAHVVVRHRQMFERANALSVFRVSEGALSLLVALGFERSSVERWSHLPLSVESPLTRAALTKHPVRVVDVDALDAQMPTLGPSLAPGESTPRGSWLAWPLVSVGEVLGVIGIRFEEGQLPGVESDPYLSMIAQTVAQSLARARTYAQMRAAAEFEERMLAVVGHDLRTPLSALTYGVEALKLSDADGGLVGRMERSIKRMAELVEDVLNRAAVRRGHGVRTETSAADIETLVRDQVEELRAALPQAEIGLEVQGPVGQPCEPTRTAQILANLVRNAAQHGFAGTPIVVRLRGGVGRTELSVHNLGHPIPEGDVAALFNPFKRGRRASGSGTGLGLFIVHESVTVLGGSVEVVSNASGTVFTVMLPPFDVCTPLSNTSA